MILRLLAAVFIVLCLIGTTPSDASSNLANWSWDFKKIDSIADSNKKVFGTDIKDCTGDGYADVVCGAYFYKNPGQGRDISTSNWPRSDFGDTLLDGLAIIDSDGNNIADVVAIKKGGGLYWIEATNQECTSWDVRLVNDDYLFRQGNEHQDGQGYAAVRSGQNWLIAINKKGTGVILYESNSTTNWQGKVITTTECCGIGVGKINNDDLPDFAGGKLEVFWIENPGTFSGTWTKHRISGNDSVSLDRCEVADISGDNKNDVVIGEEGGANRCMVFINPGTNQTQDNWDTNIVATAGTNTGYLSLHCADFDQDDRIDIITGEATNNNIMQIWRNYPYGTFTPFTVSSNNTRQSHIGCFPFDLDKDGDLDIVSNSHQQPENLYLWESKCNDCTVGVLPNYNHNDNTTLNVTSISLNKKNFTANGRTVVPGKEISRSKNPFRILFSKKGKTTPKLSDE